MDFNMIKEPAAVGAPTGLLALFSAISATTWSYDGMGAVCYMAGEIKEPEKTMPRALIISVLLIIILYVSLTTVITGLLPIADLAASDAPVAAAAAQIPLIGNAASKIIAIMAIIVITGSLSSCVMFQPRIEYAMARDGLFFKSFGKVHPKWETPYFNLVQCAVAIILIFASNISIYLDISLWLL